MRRTQIRLEPEQHQALAEIARQEGRSISDVVREMVRQQLEQRAQADDVTLQRRLEALERLRRHRDEMIRRRDGRSLELDVAEIIRQTRGEQDERNLTGFPDLRE